MKLIHGDCIEEMDKLIEQGVKVDAVITDPPYNINFVPPRGTHEAIKNDNLTSKEFQMFLDETMYRAKKLLKEDTFIISFMGWSTIPVFSLVLAKYFTIKSMPVWIKNNFGIGYYTRPQYEPMYLCLNGKPKPVIKPISDVIYCEKVYETVHSCQKPVKLMEKLITTFTSKGQTILDPFMGSGSTGVAAKNTNRNFIGIELDQNYFEIAKNRIENTTSLFGGLNDYR